MSLAGSAYDSLTMTRIGSGPLRSLVPGKQKTPRGESGVVVWVWRPGVGQPDTTRACARLTVAAKVEAADWPRTRPNFDIRSHNSEHKGGRDFAPTVRPWGKRGAPATGWHHGQRRAVIRRRDGGWLRGAGDRHRVAGSAVGVVQACRETAAGPIQIALQWWKTHARLSKNAKTTPCTVALWEMSAFHQ
jgi:hypothetical protein